MNRRDDDPVVWRAWLDWAMAAGETGPVCEALAHLPAGLFDAGRVQGLRAWLAVRQHDAQAERRALELRLAEDPSDPASLTRLAELLHEAGDKPAAARLRRRKADLDVDRDRYFRLYKLNRFADHLVELRGWRSDWAGGSRRMGSGNWSRRRNRLTPRPDRPWPD